MSSRSYLSIGDVLTLLREEFPDVTISKIRFLESQGLVNPERSPSGYRKFFDHDVERLRWVLRQQREHFLPLKVIRDRLADGELDDTEVTAGNGSSRATATRAAAAAGHGPATTQVAVAEVDEQPTKADEEAMARILADASRRTARLPEAVTVASGAGARGGLQVVDPVPATDAPAPADTPKEAPSPVAVGASVAAPSAGQRPSRVASGGAHGPAEAKASAARGGAAKPTPASSGGEPPAAAAPTSTPTAGGSEPEPEKGEGDPTASATGPTSTSTTTPAAGASGGRAARQGSSSMLPDAVVTGASMTGDELCAASGLSPEELAGLEGFGLIEPAMVAGIANYDEDALTLANLAAQLRTFGIEARHLRLYRNAVDRELGLIEQVIIPLLRQRNPEARQRAVETSDQLAALGQAMRATLLRQALRHHLGG